MAEDIDASVIKKTQEIVGSVVKRPALTEKSLKKPPFRFLHDIITNVYIFLIYVFLKNEQLLQKKKFFYIQTVKLKLWIFVFLPLDY